jgi:XTP/dITP diphosphohydrolase
MNNKTIILASNNQGKIKEIKYIFKDYDVIALKEAEQLLGKELIVKEDQETFKDNALEKVRTLYDQVGDTYTCIADDSGLSIDSLDGFPGVHTARWMDADDHTKNLMLLERLEGKVDRTCHYTTVIALKAANDERVFEYTLDGQIADNCRGNNGFGFDEIFEIENGKTLAEISTEEKASMSPRTKALEKIEQYLIDKE